VQIEHDPAAHRFSTVVDGERAVLDYRLDGNTMTITHTGVPRPIGGRGIAAELVQSALAAARGQGWTVVAACSYAADYMAKHPHECAELRQHESDLLDEALEESFPASDPPAIGHSS
jgi:predicted GNAT family acetyltransferase